MKLTKDQVLSVVTEASKKMAADANYTSVMVGGFVQSQQPISNFIQAHERELDVDRRRRAVVGTDVARERVQPDREQRVQDHRPPQRAAQPARFVLDAAHGVVSTTASLWQ